LFDLRDWGFFDWIVHLFIIKCFLHISRLLVSKHLLIFFEFLFSLTV
jgi:hypothetical protein